MRAKWYLKWDRQTRFPASSNLHWLIGWNVGGDCLTRWRQSSLNLIIWLFFVVYFKLEIFLTSYHVLLLYHIFQTSPYPTPTMVKSVFIIYIIDVQFGFKYWLYMYWHTGWFTVLLISYDYKVNEYKLVVLSRAAILSCEPLSSALISWFSDFSCWSRSSPAPC